jgi:hypothetical protein
MSSSLRLHEVLPSLIDRRIDVEAQKRGYPLKDVAEATEELAAD